jgi:hypothetical protein
VRESGRLGGYLRVFSYRGVLCKSVEVQGGKVKFPLIHLINLRLKSLSVESGKRELH